MFTRAGGGEELLHAAGVDAKSAMRSIKEFTLRASFVYMYIHFGLIVLSFRQRVGK